MYFYLLKIIKKKVSDTIQTILIIVFLIAQLYINFIIVERIICKQNNEFVQVFAPPGVGKSTLAAKIVKNALRENKKVYSNVEIAQALKFKLSDLGKKQFEDCVLIIDEAGVELANRDWRKNLNKAQINFLKKHRHYNVNIYLFSQSYNDVDNKFRELTTKLILLEKSKLCFFVNMLCIRKRIDIIDGKIIDYYYFSKHENSKFFIVDAWAYFNSYAKDERLPDASTKRYLKSEFVEN